MYTTKDQMEIELEAIRVRLAEIHSELQRLPLDGLTGQTFSVRAAHRSDSITSATDSSEREKK